MYRTIPYRGFEIHVELATSAEDLYDVSFRIKGGQNLALIGAGTAASGCVTGPLHDAGRT